MAHPIKLSAYELSQIHAAAKLYDQELLGKDVSFYYYQDTLDQGKILTSLDVRFDKANFPHLVGLKRAPHRVKAASELFDKALNNELTSEDVLATNGRGAMDAKLDVYPLAMTISSKCQLIGQLSDDIGINISSDYLIGRTPVAVSFVETASGYVPNSVLNTDFRQITSDETRTYIVGSIENDGRNSQIRMLQKDISPEAARDFLSEAERVSCIPNELLGKLRECLAPDSEIGASLDGKDVTAFRESHAAYQLEEPSDSLLTTEQHIHSEHEAL